MRTGKSLPGRENQADTARPTVPGPATQYLRKVAPGTRPAHHERPARRGSPARRIAAPVVLATAAVLVLAGCGVRPSAVIPGVPAPSGPVAPEISTSTVLYFVMADRPTATQREGTRTSPADVLTLLAAGPDDEERAAGLTTEVPANAVPVSVTTAPSGVTVVLGIDVSELSTMAIQQISCTLRRQNSATATVPPVTLTGGGQVRGPLGCPFWP